MVEKMYLHGEGDGFRVPIQGTKRRHTTLSSLLGDVMARIPLSELERRLEPMIRKPIREEVDRVIQTFSRSSRRSLVSEAGTSGEKGLQLQFLKNLPKSVFTCSKIKDEDGRPLQVVLVDAGSGNIVHTGPLSSAKVDILVLGGEFGSDEQEDWSERDFHNSIQPAREDKGPLITGTVSLTLNAGVAFVDDLAFTDNSSWVRSRTFSLGAKIGTKTSVEARIREAKTKPFTVKDHRGEAYQKHHPPHLHDEIRRLEKIGPVLNTRLASYGIQTVKDFLQRYESGPLSLRKLLGNSERTWKAIVEHANSCVVDDHKLYAYHSSGPRPRVILFNSIWRVVAVSYDGRSYSLVESLSNFQKYEVEKLKQDAYANSNLWIPIDERSIGGLPMPLPNLQADANDHPNIVLPQFDSSVIRGDRPLSTSFTCEAEKGTAAQDFHLPPLVTEAAGYDFPEGDYVFGESIEPLGHFESGGHLAENWISVCQTPPWSNSPFCVPLEQGNQFFFPSSSEAEAEIDASFHSSGSNTGGGRKRKRWFQVWAAVKCSLSVRRNVAAKRAMNAAAAERMPGALYASCY